MRNKLDDKSQFGLKPNLAHRISAKDRELEDELNKERYLALEWDDIRVEEQEGGLYLEYLKLCSSLLYACCRDGEEKKGECF